MPDFTFWPKNGNIVHYFCGAGYLVTSPYKNITFMITVVIYALCSGGRSFRQIPYSYTPPCSVLQGPAPSLLLCLARLSHRSPGVGAPGRVGRPDLENAVSEGQRKSQLKEQGTGRWRGKPVSQSPLHLVMREYNEYWSSGRYGSKPMWQPR